MANMFDKKTQIGGAFNGNEMVLTFAGFGAGYLIRSVEAGYNVQVSRLRELGSPRTYYVKGDSSGTIGLSQVTGPSESIVPLVRAYSDICGIAQNVINLSFAAGQCAAFSGGDKGMIFDGVLFSKWHMNASAEAAMTASTTVNGTYEGLEYGDEGGIAGALNAAGNVAASLGL